MPKCQERAQAVVVVNVWMSIRAECHASSLSGKERRESPDHSCASVRKVGHQCGSGESLPTGLHGILTTHDHAVNEVMNLRGCRGVVVVLEAHLPQFSELKQRVAIERREKESRIARKQVLSRKRAAVVD